MGDIIANLIILSICIFTMAQKMPGFRIKTPQTAVVVAVTYSLINFFFSWILAFLALPFIVLTMGLFYFVINAALLWVTDMILEDFKIDGIKTTFIAAAIITVVGVVSRAIF